MILLSLLTATISHAACVPARESVAFEHGGQYHRVHPSGNYVLYSSGGVHIADITDRANPKRIETPMQAETYPVEAANGGWELLASPYDNGYMQYYQIKDILSKGASATSVHKDPEHNQYYHSAAELPGSTPSTRKVRVMLYGNSIREIEFTKGRDGNFSKTKASSAGQKLCLSLDGKRHPELELNAKDQAIVAGLISKLSARRVEAAKLGEERNKLERKWYEAEGRESERLGRSLEALNKRVDKITNEIFALETEKRVYDNGSEAARLSKRSQEIEKQLNKASSSVVINRLEAEQARLSEQFNRLQDLSFYNPVLSKDGTLLAVNGAYTTAVYRVKGGGLCELVADTGLSASKVSFSYPEPGKLPKITFTAESGPSGGNTRAVYQYDLNNREATRINSSRGEGSYPGFTKDGRVIYSTGVGFEIVDPNQVNGTDPNTCIKASAIAPAGNSSTEAGSGQSAE